MTAAYSMAELAKGGTWEIGCRGLCDIGSWDEVYQSANRPAEPRSPACYCSEPLEPSKPKEISQLREMGTWANKPRFGS